MFTITIEDNQFRVPKLSDRDALEIRSAILTIAPDFDDNPIDAIFDIMEVIASDVIGNVVDRVVRKAFVRLPTGAWASLRFEAVAEQTFADDLTLPFQLVWQAMKAENPAAFKQ